MSAPHINFVFFGTPDIAVTALEALAAKNLFPKVIVTAPDAPQGRGLSLLPSPVKSWARANNIPTIELRTLKTPEAEALLDPKRYEISAWDVFVLVAYGKIIPPNILALPKHGVVNMHPSVLPRHRGASPIESQILSETDGANVGVTVMLLDEELDHGPIIATRSMLPELVHQWPISATELRPLLAQCGGELLAETLPRYVAGEISPTPQNHEKATLCGRIKKEDALLNLADDPEKNYRKILAYDAWPRAFFFAKKGGRDVRIIVTRASLRSGELLFEKVIPEGSREMSFADFKNGGYEY